LQEGGSIPRTTWRHLLCKVLPDHQWIRLFEKQALCILFVSQRPSPHLCCSIQTARDFVLPEPASVISPLLSMRLGESETDRVSSRAATGCTGTYNAAHASIVFHAASKWAPAGRDTTLLNFRMSAPHSLCTFQYRNSGSDTA
jgi:hypothetical protein